mgnify:CR=1 FL=1
MINTEELDVLKLYIEKELMSKINPQKKSSMKKLKKQYVKCISENKEKKQHVYHNHLPNEITSNCPVCK